MYACMYLYPFILLYVMCWIMNAGGGKKANKHTRQVTRQCLATATCWMATGLHVPVEFLAALVLQSMPSF